MIRKQRLQMVNSKVTTLNLNEVFKILLALNLVTLYLITP